MEQTTTVVDVIEDALGFALCPANKSFLDEIDHRLLSALYNALLEHETGSYVRVPAASDGNPIFAVPPYSPSSVEIGESRTATPDRIG
jgi:hypothetical protein